LVEDPAKTTNLSQVTDKLYLIMLYTSSWSRFELTTSVVITDCIGSWYFSYIVVVSFIWVLSTWWRLLQKHVVHTKNVWR
jgi:hypothetical protein